MLKSDSCASTLDSRYSSRSCGRTLIDRAYRTHSQTLTQVFGCLDESERNELIRLLKTVGRQAEQLTTG